mgnify:CR=1 FL=1
MVNNFTADQIGDSFVAKLIEPYENVAGINSWDIVAGVSTPNTIGTLSMTEGNLTVTGNLTVSGTTTTVNSETLTINDNLIVLNNNEAGTPSENAGVEIERGTSTNVQLRWNETTDCWEFTNDGTNYQRIFTDTVTNAQVASYTLVLADSGKMVEMNNASANTLTIPPNSSVALPVGTTITVLQEVKTKGEQAAGKSLLQNWVSFEEQRESASSNWA